MDVNKFTPGIECVDIIALQETWLCGSTSASLKGYRWFGQNSPLPGQRGVGFLCHEQIAHLVERQPSLLDTILWIKLNLKPRPLFLCCAYGPQERSTTEEEREAFWNELYLSTARLITQGHVCILADANARVGRAHPRVGKFGEEQLSANGEQLLSICESLGLRVLNNSLPRDVPAYTRVQNDQRSVLDYIVVSDSLSRPDLDVAVISDAFDSDHYPVYCSLDLSRPARKGRAQRTRKWRTELLKVGRLPPVGPQPGAQASADALTLETDPKKTRKPAQDYHDEYNAALRREFTTPTSEEELPERDIGYIKLSDNVDEAYKQVTDRIARAAELVIGKKTVGPSSRHWWDAELKDAIARRRVALLAGDKKRYRELAKEARRLAKKKKADAAERLAAELDQARKEDPKRFWRTIKALGGLCRSSAITTEVQRQDGSKSADPKVVLEEFKNHFEKLHNEGHDATLFDKENFERISKWAQEDREQPVVDEGEPPSQAEILKAIEAQAVGAPGTDGIPMELLKYGAPALANQLERLFAISGGARARRRRPLRRQSWSLSTRRMTPRCRATIAA